MESLGDILKRAHIVRDTPTETVQSHDVCPVCKGAGYLRHDVAVDDPRFGELIACECTRRDVERRRLDRLIERSNLGGLRRHTFESFIRKIKEGEPPAMSPDSAWTRAKSYAEDPRGWLVIYGGFGTGKTHLAAAIVNYRLSLAEPAVFIVVPDLLDHLRSTFSPSSEVTYDELFETVRNIPLLVLDDLGAQTTTAWAQEKLYQIINHRYNRTLPTVITTNLSPDEIEPRLRSRIGDSQVTQLCQIRSVDRRLGIAHPGPQSAGSGGAPRSSRKVRHESP